MGVLGRVRRYGSLVRFSHTVFALPFAVIGAVLAARGLPDGRTCLLILLAMVGARTAGMAMNRLADRRLDSANPRTSGRELPAGVLLSLEVRLLLLVAAAVFVTACALLNPLTFVLSPVVLAVLFTYPFAKRFTSLCHLWLGAGLGLSPVGAWVAVRGGFGEGFPAVFLVGAAVLCWTAGFDVIYALLDEEHDREVGLYSLPSRLGAGRALAVSTILHVLTVALLAGAGVIAGLGPFSAAGLLLTAGLLSYEHWIVRPGDLSRVNTAFFTLNGAVSLVLMACVVADVLRSAAPSA